MQVDIINIQVACVINTPRMQKTFSEKHHHSDIMIKFYSDQT